MSLSSSLNSALSGLSAASRSVNIVSSNVSNAMTDGYARREISLASQTVGGDGAGVKVVGVTRVVNERALSDQRDATANMSNAGAQADAWLAIETSLGYPTEEGSLSQRIDAFENALVEAASRPEETVRLDAAVTAAVSLADGINDTAGDIQQLRMDADADIASLVDQVNTQLEQVQSLNWQIFRMGNGGQDVSSLMDERQALVDSLAEIIPVRQVERDGNQVALYTSGGATLVDGPAAELTFEPHATITADMTLENGLLSGLEINGQPVSFDAKYGTIEGGLLSAAFEVRDGITVEAQAGLDALARELIDRFQDTGLDATVAVNGTGLFTEGGSEFNYVDSSDETGLSSRISVNNLVDPAAGGESWRLRDGVGAVSPGEVGDSSLLMAMADLLAEASQPATGPSAGLSRSISGMASDLLSTVDLNYRTQEDAQTFHQARSNALAEEIALDGVDTDDEMQKLLLIEQLYAANAQVIQTVDQLMQRLMEI